jgi:amino acid adenylation domain-containing protein
VARLFSATQEWFHFDSSDVWTLFHSFAFDFSVWEMWGALLHGGRLVVVPGLISRSPQEFYELVCTQGVTVLNQTPSAFRQLIGVQGQSEKAHRLRYVIFGGEALEVGMLEGWYERSANGMTQLINMYGITETTVHVTYQPLQMEDTRRSGASPIGRRIPDLRVYVLDRHREPVPIGVTGELYVGGAGVARGYLNRPELTAERFVKDPFSAEADARMYRTGDLGRYREDGNLEYLGRNDSQVKIRGFRIELGEIEARMAKVEGVREAVVVAREDAPGERRLVAYYTGVLLSAEILREHVLSVLPQYMVPAGYVHLDSLPLTPNGKLDRKALPAPGGECYASRGYEEPEGEIEWTLAGLWSELLKVERVGRQDSFFELGGHSLSAVQLISRIRQGLEVEIGLTELFESPRLAELAQRVRAIAPAPLERIERVSREGAQLLSLAQQRLWFLARMEGASAAYHIRGAVRLSGELSVEALRRALQGIVRRHEPLRTCFCLIEEEPRQQILEADEVLLEIDEREVLRGAGTAEVSGVSEVQRCLAEHAQAPFDLERDLPMRVLLLRLEEREWLLQIVMHHIASDGWSVGILLNELSQLYGAHVHDETDPLPPLGIQYADYAAWQRRQLVSSLRQQSEFWRENLSDAPLLLELPTDRARPKRQDYAGTSVEVRLEGPLTEGMKRLSQRHGVTLYMTLLASWAVLLGRLSGQGEVVIGSPAAGRNRADLESLVGCFVNTLALRVQVSGELTVEQLLRRTRDQVLAAQRHQDLPFEQVVEIVQPPRSLRHTPLFQVMFDWQNTPVGELRMPGVKLSPVDTPANTAQFDLSLSLEEGPAGIGGTLNYATALFDQETVQRYLSYWMCLLQSLLTADEDGPIAGLNLMPQAERNRVLFEWNDTAQPYAQQLCVHELFEAQVKRTPEATAVWQDGQRLSYAQLNRQANQLAHYLRTLGVRPDTRVGMCLERSMEMVLGLLAIFKAGGAYVPLDPDYPRERIAYMLRDSAPLVALTVGPARAVLAASQSLHDAITVLDLRSDAARWSEFPAHDPSAQEVGLTAEHLAYVIYTSGSTGVPKGVMIEHRGLVNYTLEAIRWFELDSRDTVLQQNSLNFDLSIEESLPALLSGATLLPSAELFGVLDNWKAGHQGGPVRQPSVVHLTVAHWHSLVGEWSQSGTPVQPMLEGVRLINVTGDALSVHKLQQWRTLKPARTRLINTYGPTEATVSCSAAYLGEGPEANGVSIGKPFANTRLYILDPKMQPVPVGVSGELYIGGVQVGRGYLNQPQLTRERFVADPFVAGGRLYRSGDLGRWLADGSIQFLGRNDFQVKLRGFRIELGEIEAHLGRLGGVREVVAMVRGGADGEQRLVAYYTGMSLPAEALREHAISGLPQYMVPVAYVHLDALPLTPNGKLDRKALPAPEGESYASRAYEEPTGEIEQRLARLWSQLLKVERVGRHDNFFELGGHSLLGISLIERMRKENLRADVALLFAAPTLADMASATVKIMEIVL